MSWKLSLLVSFCILTASVLGLAEDLPPFEIGDDATDFTVQNLGEDGEGGDTVNLSDYLGEIVVIDFWATWCTPCRKAVPELEAQIHQAYEDRGVFVWGIDMDPAADDFASLDRFREQYNVTYQLALDVNKDAWQKYTWRPKGAVPTMYIIDQDGKVRFTDRGYSGQPTIDALIVVIEELLASEPQEPTFELRLNKMEATPYNSGDTMTLTADVSNPGAPLAVVIYVAIEMNGQFFFWPSYSTMMEGVPFTLPDGFVLLGHELESVTFSDSFPTGTYTWYGVIADTFGEWITTPSAVIWTFGGAAP